MKDFAAIDFETANNDQSFNDVLAGIRLDQVCRAHTDRRRAREHHYSLRDSVTLWQKFRLKKLQR